MKAKHRKILLSIFTKPTLAGIIFDDLASLITALGGQVREGEAKRYQVEELRALLKSEGIRP